MTPETKGKVLIASIVWIVIISVVALIYKFSYQPHAEKKAAEELKTETQKKFDATSSSSKYDLKIAFAVDSFSGYSVIRSKIFQDTLAQNRIELVLQDDGANYSNRIKELNNGNIQFAVFTIDAFIKGCAEINSIPGSIVSIIDETRGADAVVAYRDMFPNIDALNDPDVKFVLTTNSPSETLARVISTNFLKSKHEFIALNSPKDVYNMYRSTNHKEKLAYVLWQPYVSKVLENPNTAVIIDSSKFRGYIVDVLVVNRDFLYKNGKIAQAVVEAYLKANSLYKNNMVQLVLEDAKLTGEPLSEGQAKDLVDGIWWKNAKENYAHFGLESTSLQHIEDIVKNITKVLLQSKAINSDPTNGRANILYYDNILKNLYASSFLKNETLREDILPPLSETEWAKLQPVGTLEVPEIYFARGTSKISEKSDVVLKELAENLENFPNYYLVIYGEIASIGDLEANKVLAEQRAKAIAEYLVNCGISSNRIKFTTKQGVLPSVTFVLGQ